MLGLDTVLLLWFPCWLETSSYAQLHIQFRLCLLLAIVLNVISLERICVSHGKMVKREPSFKLVVLKVPTDGANDSVNWIKGSSVTLWSRMMG